MNSNTQSRSKFLHIRLKESEFDQVSKQFAESMDQTMSEFVRKKLLDTPIIRKYRNISVDECMTELIQLRNDLIVAGSGIRLLGDQMNDSRSPDQLIEWTVLLKKCEDEFLQIVEQIKEQVNKISDTWLQTSTMEKDCETR